VDLMRELIGAPDCFVVESEVAAALGVTREQLAAMHLREFMELVFERGMTCRVTSKRALDGEGKLTIRMSPSPQGQQP
jgi:hypothetical protein